LSNPLLLSNIYSETENSPFKQTEYVTVVKAPYTAQNGDSKGDFAQLVDKYLTDLDPMKSK
jgi:hypothetical protein